MNLYNLHQLFTLILILYLIRSTLASGEAAIKWLFWLTRCGPQPLQLAVDVWAVTFGTVRRGQPAQAPLCCTKCNSPPINASVPMTVLLRNSPLLSTRTSALTSVSLVLSQAPASTARPWIRASLSHDVLVYSSAFTGTQALTQDSSGWVDLGGWFCAGVVYQS